MFSLWNKLDYVGWRVISASVVKYQLQKKTEFLYKPFNSWTSQLNKEKKNEIYEVCLEYSLN